MQINPVSSASAIQSSHITPTQVSAAALQRAAADGDGRTGAAALNDGDSAAQQARLHAVNIKA